MASGLIGRLVEFDPQEEAISAYLLRMKHYFKTNSVKEDNKVSVLITVIGPKVLATLSDLVSPTEIDAKTYDELVEVLKNHYSPKKLVVAERYLFYSRFQKPGETIAEFVVSIKHLASSCKFSTFLKDSLRDRLVCGISNEVIRQKLLAEEKDFDGTYALALLLEQAERQSTIFSQPHGHEVAKMCFYKSKSIIRPKFKVNSANGPRPSSVKCWRCGSAEHGGNGCPYSSYKCNGCKQIGHLFKMCKQCLRPSAKLVGQGRGKAKTFGQVHQINQETKVEQAIEDFSLYNIGLGLGETNTKGGYKVGLVINNTPISVELDTGSALTICPTDIFNDKFPGVQLKHANIKLLTYAGNDVPVEGQANVDVAYNGQYVTLPLVVVNIDRPNQPMLLGRNWLSKIKLDWHSIFACEATVCKESTESRPTGNLSFTDDSDVLLLKTKFKSVFQAGVGEIKGVQAQIVLKDGACPKFCKFRPVPFALRARVEDELGRMERDGVAYRVSKSEWSTPLVVVPKPNGVRLCADFKVTLNQCIEMEHYPLPQADDIFASLSGCTFFSVLDLSNAYQQLVVAEESQHLLTLSTHKGLYRLRRLPYGLSSAPAIFQSVIDQIIGDLPGAVAYLDDLLVGGTSRAEALTRLEMVLQQLDQYNVRVNLAKCKFLQTSVEYLGYVISADGLRPQERIVAAIRDAPEPANKDELRAFVGLINYYGKFIPNLSDRLSCFYDLLHKNAVWNWSPKCSQVFKNSKQWVIKSSVLVHYDEKKPLVLTCDASPRGVGAVLSHVIEGEERPVAFASKTLSDCEKNYSQLHREALALIFGVKKFHKYIYGRTNCILQTDHQPLAAIFGSKRGIPSLAAARLQRWALILSAYNFEVKYKKGADIPHADALSRLPLPDKDSLELENNYFSHVNTCLQVMNMTVESESLVTAADVGKMTGRDPVLSRVRDFVSYGWRNCTAPELSIFLRKKDELSLEQNCILWGARVVVPVKLRPTVLRMLHDQHPGITRMKLLARSYVWWPGLDEDIQNMVSSCHICQYTRNASPRVPLQQWPATIVNWQRIHIDFAEDTHTKQQLLVLVDSYSKWLEVFIMNSTTSAKTIEKLRTLFSSYGLPEELVSDNGTAFTSFEFRDFLKQNGIRFTLTPPYHAASNGAAERSVQEVKKSLLRQVIEEHQNSKSTSLQHKLDNFLFAYRNTPSSVTGATPSELFLKWKPKTKLAFLKPNLQNRVASKKSNQKEASDRFRGSPRYFVEGQKVLVKTVRQEKISWVPGQIVQQRSPVTYLVSVLGRTRFCHADHLRSQNLEEEYFICRGPDEQTPTRIPVEPRNTPPLVNKSPKIASPECGSSLTQVREEGPATTQHGSPLNLRSPAKTKEDEVVARRAQCSPPQLVRRSSRPVRKPKKLDL